MKTRIRSKKTIIIICAAALCIGAVLAWGFSGKDMYVAAEGPQAACYSEQLEAADPLIRGTMVKAYRSTAKDEDGSMLRKIKTEGEIRYIPEGSLCEKEDDVVLEQKVYVRTPVTLCKEVKGVKIAGFAPKGAVLEVLGFDEVRDDGVVGKYHVRYGKREGWAGGSYLVMSQKEADKKCNEKGAYDMAKKAKFHMELHGGKATNLDYFPKEKPELSGNELCRDARAMYLNAGALMKDKYFKLAQKSGANAVVINIDGGTPAYKSPVIKAYSPTAYKHARYSLEKYQKAVRKYQDAGFYTVGRIVCFNDEAYAKDHPDECIRTGGSRTSWVSAYSRKCWEYKVALAVEAVETMGFDEIQYDYVRFPERAYQMSTSAGTDFRNTYKEEKAQAIQNFCMYAADRIHEAGAYLSVDVFGECSNGYVSAYGQYWPAISNVVDVISSMPYTDHQGEADTWTHPYDIMHSWAKKSADMQKHIPTPAVARTWVTGYDTPHWAPSVDYDYGKLKDQVRALKDAGLDGGFIPWNSSSSYNKYKEYSKIWSYK